MKKRRRILVVGVLMLVVFLAVSLLTFLKSSDLIEQGYLASEGSAAENFAVLAASNIHLTDEQVEKLKSYTYEEMQSSPENEQLRAMMSNNSFATKVDYAYVMVHLLSSEVKYHVTEDTQELYGAPVGTELDIMWLLEVAVSREAEPGYMPEYSPDTEAQEHFATYIEEDARILSSSPSYVYNESGWGNHICGYAPLYTVEGHYIGALGVELQTSDFDSYRSAAIRAMGLLLAVSSLTLAAMFIVLYIQYKKMQFDRIYTDPLTQISNRSYYNDQFIKRLNSERPHPACFGLMIADIDWFKKVNDTFGHEIGDQVLLEVGQILLDSFGKSHVVRFGGEEFLVGLWAESPEKLREKLDKLYADIAAHKFSTQQIEITLSLGCCWRREKELSGWLLSGMLRAADCELYGVKESGRRRYSVIEYDENRQYEKKDGPVQRNCEAAIRGINDGQSDAKKAENREEKRK